MRRHLFAALPLQPDDLQHLIHIFFRHPPQGLNHF